MPKELGFYYLNDRGPPKTFEWEVGGGGEERETGSCSGFWNVNGDGVEEERGQDDSFVQGKGPSQ